MRLFVGIVTPPDVDDAVDAGIARALEAWARAEHVRLRWVPREGRHVTVRFVGESADPHPLIEAVERAAGSMPAPVLRVGPRVERLTSTALVLPVAGADGIAATVARELRVAAGRFTGHLTVARLRGRPRTPPEHAPVTASWTPATLDVIESRPGGFPRFVTLARATWGA